MRQRTYRALSAILLAAIALSGCSTKMSEKDRANVSVAYAEMLLVKNMYRYDSVHAARAADSVVRHYGYGGEQELMKKIKDLTNDPESLRLVLDSAQHRLEKIQQGIDPDIATPRPATTPPPQPTGR